MSKFIEMLKNNPPTIDNSVSFLKRIETLYSYIDYCKITGEHIFFWECVELLYFSVEPRINTQKLELMHKEILKIPNKIRDGPDGQFIDNVFIYKSLLFFRELNKEIHKAGLQITQKGEDVHD